MKLNSSNPGISPDSRVATIATAQHDNSYFEANNSSPNIVNNRNLLQSRLTSGQGMPRGITSPVTPDVRVSQSLNGGGSIKYNESLRQYINRIYGSSVNPFIEASIHQTVTGNQKVIIGNKQIIKKQSMSAVRKLFQLKESNGEQITTGKIFKNIDTDYNSQLFQTLTGKPYQCLVLQRATRVLLCINIQNMINFSYNIAITKSRKAANDSSLGYPQERSSKNKNLLSAINGYPSQFNEQQYSDREKRLLIEKVEEKLSMSNMEKHYKSALPSPGGKLTSFATVTPNNEEYASQKGGTYPRETTIDLNVKELRDNFDRIPSHIKYQKKLVHEIETLQFSLFLGLSKLELLQGDDTMSQPISKGGKTGESFDQRSQLSRDILEPPKLKVSAPSHICSLFQDINELFQQILDPNQTIHKQSFFYAIKNQQQLIGASVMLNNPISILNTSQGEIDTHNTSVIHGGSDIPQQQHQATFGGTTSDKRPETTGTIGGRFDLIDDEMIDVHRKFRAFVTYLQNQTGFLNAVTADLLWNSVYVKYEQCFVKLQRRFERESNTLKNFVKEQFARQEQMLKDFDLERKETAKKHDDLVRQLNAQIKELTRNRTMLEGQVEVSKIELEGLTRFDKRKEAILDIEDAFDKLNGYIGEINGKKKKTFTMLRKLQILMDADRGKLTKASKDIQTDDSHMQAYMAGEIKFQSISYISSLVNNRLKALKQIPIEEVEDGKLKQLSESETEHHCNLYTI